VRARRTPRRKVLFACSAIRPPSAHRRLITELPDTVPSLSSSWHTLTAVRSRSAYSAYTAMSAVLIASFAAVSSATCCLSSDQRNQDKLRKTRIQQQRNLEHPPAMFFCASSRWTRAASSSEDKEFSFSLRAVSAFRRATSFPSRVPVSVATVAFSRWSSASLPWSSASFALELGFLLLERHPSALQLSGLRLGFSSLLLRCGPLDVTLTGSPR